MSEPGPDLVPRVVLVSQLLVFLGIMALAALFPYYSLDPWPWTGVVGTVALGYPVIVVVVRRVEPSSRPRALRWANMLVTPLCAVVMMPIAAVGLEDPAGRWIELALEAGVFGLMGAVLADLGRFLLPDSWRDLDRPFGLWSPSLRTNIVIALAWLPLTAIGFWWVTGVTGDGSCVLGGTCNYGLPATFANFGLYDSMWTMNWGHFWRDVGIFATLIPALHGIATSRLRAFFCLYLAGIGFMLIMSARWNARLSMEVWMMLDLLAL